MRSTAKQYQETSVKWHQSSQLTGQRAAYRGEGGVTAGGKLVAASSRALEICAWVWRAETEQSFHRGRHPQGDMWLPGPFLQTVLAFCCVCPGQLLLRCPVKADRSWELLYLTPTAAHTLYWRWTNALTKNRIWLVTVHKRHTRKHRTRSDNNMMVSSKIFIFYDQKDAWQIITKRNLGVAILIWDRIDFR